ncbi:MAG: alpha-amylase family glycosyl hydrolase, partial [Clostridia bacterium]
MEKYKILEIDPYLGNFERDINLRMDRYDALKKRLTKDKSLIEFASAYEFYGIHKTEGGYVYREWAPNAKALFFLGDFNGWNNSATPMRSIGNGNWEVFVPFDLKNTYVKVRVCADNYDMERIPLYIQYVARDENSYSMTARILESDYQFKNKNFKRSKNPPMIYECHIGMAQEKEGVGTYEEFRLNILPKIKALGFNTIQIMGIMEHPYYGSFGYQVSNFFAPCSLFGTPDDLKRLVDDAHGMGIAVLLDIVHSHAVKNTLEGINLFDGSESQFFTGDHPAWGSKIFDYSKDGVLQFLLSNVKYYLDVFKFDGFRFDGVTSMLYTHNGLGTAFDSYDK